MTAVRRIEASHLVSPLQGYDLAEWQRRQLGGSFRARIIRLYGARAERPFFSGTGLADEDSLYRAYRDLVMDLGVKRVDPASTRFRDDLGEFHRNYVRNFPLPAEQESFNVFYDLLSEPARRDGYQELCYSVICPLTGQYLMGANFAVQPQSNSVFLIYGFVNPIACGIGRFPRRLIGLVREKSKIAIAAYFDRHPERRPAYYHSSGPLILFEKNVIEDMSLPDILMDCAGIDIDRPPTVGACLTSSAIGQRIWDLVGHRCGARVADYKYLQPSLAGVLSDRSRTRAQNTLKRCLGDKSPGCAAISLCALSSDDKGAIPLDQLRRAVESFQAAGVVKEPHRLGDGIYFQAQMTSLAEHAARSEIRLRPIRSSGSGVEDIEKVEDQTRRLLRGVTWEDLRCARERPYREWLTLKSGQSDDRRFWVGHHPKS